MGNQLYSLLFLSIVMFSISCQNPANQNTSSTDTITQAHSTVTIDDVPDTVSEFLMLASVKDFKQHNPGRDLDFRNSKIGYKEKSNGEKVFMLCGEFRMKNQEKWSEWSPYTAIKTDPYEQWLGSQAASFLQDTAVVWFNSNDFSAKMKHKFDSLNVGK